MTVGEEAGGATLVHKKGVAVRFASSQRPPGSTGRARVSKFSAPHLRGQCLNLFVSSLCDLFVVCASGEPWTCLARVVNTSSYIASREVLNNNDIDYGYVITARVT